MRKIFGIFVLCLLSGCTDGLIPKAEPCLVIEGWIEEGRFPVVLLSTTVPVGEEEKDMESLRDHVVRWGKVTISDGEREVILTGGPDERFIPPYSYTTARMRGEAGKEYTVTAEYDGHVATATTVIPEGKDLKYLKAETLSSGKSRIVAGLKDDASEKNFYKFFVMREGKDSTYMSSFLGLVNDEILKDGVNEVAVYNSMNVREGEFDQYFEKDDVVRVRFCTLDEASWEYWSDFEEIQSLSRNPFFPVSKMIRSNVTGGLGYWAGYGSRYYKVDMSSSSSEQSK